VTHAARLQGALLLTVGELDTNVDPASTMQVANALMKADKDYELIVVPGGGHGCGEARSMQRKRVDFFREHLMNP
jgi:dipeptidyl aminopeptidase/acylaminoacyl peptidase